MNTSIKFIYIFFIFLFPTISVQSSPLIPKGTIITRSDTKESYFEVLEDIQYGEEIFTNKKIKILKEGFNANEKIPSSIYVGFRPVKCIHTKNGWIPFKCF